MGDFYDDLRDKQQIRDQLGREDAAFTVFDVFNETFKLQELATTVSVSGVGTSFILGSDTRGLLGTSAVNRLGRDPIYGIPQLSNVVNPFNRHIEYLRGTTFVDGTVTTATIDTNNFTITF